MKNNAHHYFSRGLKAACLFLCVLIPLSSFADIPKTLSIQGQVNDINQGTGLQGNFDVRFTLYDLTGRSTQYMDLGKEYVDPTGSGASVIWTSVINVAFDNGQYSTQLGTNIPFPDDAFISENEVLGIQISDDDELAPRMTLNAIPFAIRANISSNVDGDITPRSVSVADELGNVMLVIDENGQWQGHSAGLTGAQGLEGDKGDKGDKGDDGIAGVAGVAGAQGLKGDKGDDGTAGVAGDKGDKGNKGDDGITGAAGAQGPKGDTGAGGLSGSNGLPGLVGSSVVTTKQCTSGTTCSCDVNTLLIGGGAACSKNQYLYKSQPIINSKTSWEATCEVFSTGADADPVSINLLCATDNDA
jgi:hypothetical protein